MPKATQFKTMAKAKDFSSLALTTPLLAPLETLERVLLSFRILGLTERMPPLVSPPALWEESVSGIPSGSVFLFQRKAPLFLGVLLYGCWSGKSLRRSP